MQITPSDHGFLAWSGDPNQMAAGAALTDNVLGVTAVKVLPGTISRIFCNVTTAGVTFTLAVAGVYDSDLTLLGQTASMATPWASTGIKNMPLAVPGLSKAGGWLYVALLSAATTDPVFAKVNVNTTAAVNHAGLTVTAKVRAATLAAQSVLPATLTISGLTPAAEQAWVALA